MAVIGIYTKDFPDLGRAVLDTDIVPITELGNVVTYKTTIADLMNSRITGSEGQLSKFGAGNTLTNSILKEIGNAIHLTNGGSSYAAFGIVNPGTPGAPGVDNDAYIGSTINNDFLIRVNNTEALRIDTALRLKIANIQNAITDTDKFLVSDGGVVKYRSGSEVLSDLGVTPGNYVTLDGTQTITGSKTFTNGVILGTTGVDAYTISADGLARSKFNFNGKSFIFDASSIPALATLTYSMPSTTGTLALTSDIHNPVTIGTANGLSLSGQVLSLGLASSINSGALSAADYLAFSNKQNALTVSSPLSISTGPTPNIAIQVATGSQNGYLSSTDWNTFNNKISSQWTASGSNIYYNSGNVGIGTASPDDYGAGYKMLSINGSTAGILQLRSGDSGAINIAGTATSADFEAFANKIITFKTGSPTVTERMRITSGGSVLIGNPPSDNGAKLQVGGSSGAVSTPTAITMDGTYRTGGDSFSSLKFYLYKSASESYGLGLGDLSDLQYWAGTSSTGSHRFFTSHTERLKILPTGQLVKYGDSTSSRIIPGVDNVGYVGDSGNRWQAIYAVNGTIQTSDGREKTNINDSDLGLDFINKLRPVSFKWIVGENIVTEEKVTDKNGQTKTEIIVTPRAGVRNHYGFIAQEIEEALGGKDFGGFVYDKENDKYSLRYSEFISPIIKAIQEQNQLIKELNNRIIELENK